MKYSQKICYTAHMRNIIPHNAKLVPEHAECVFKGKVYSTYQWQQELFDGSFTTFEMLKRADTVQAIIIKNDTIVACHEEQPHKGSFIGIPGGCHDYENETELEAVQREVKEETGFICKNWKLLHCYQKHSKIEQFTYIFLAWDVIEQHEQQLDAGEKIKVKLYSLQDFKTLLDDPTNRSTKMRLLENIYSIEELLALPEYNAAR